MIAVTAVFVSGTVRQLRLPPSRDFRCVGAGCPRSLDWVEQAFSLLTSFTIHETPEFELFNIDRPGGAPPALLRLCPRRRNGPAAEYRCCELKNTTSTPMTALSR